MSISMHVVYLRDEGDEDHRKKVAVLRACNEAGVGVPVEINEYFQGTSDESLPLEIEAKPIPWHDDYREGFTIFVDEIPEGVKKIRFYLSS